MSIDLYSFPKNSLYVYVEIILLKQEYTSYLIVYGIKVLELEEKISQEYSYVFRIQSWSVLFLE